MIINQSVTLKSEETQTKNNVKIPGWLSEKENQGCQSPSEDELYCMGIGKHASQVCGCIGRECGHIICFFLCQWIKTEDRGK